MKGTMSDPGPRRNLTGCGRNRLAFSTATGGTYEGESWGRGHDAVPARERDPGEEASGARDPSRRLQRDGRARTRRRDFDELDTGERPSVRSHRRGNTRGEGVRA